MNKRGQIEGIIVLLAILIVILIVSAVFLFFYATDYNTTGNTIYLDTYSNNNYQNCRTVQVPYQDTENYIDRVPYLQDSHLSYRVTDKYSAECSTSGNYRECYYVSIENTDNFGGRFELDCQARVKYTDSSGDRRSRTAYLHDSNYIGPNEEEELVCVADVSSDDDVSWSYDVISPTDRELGYRDVVRTRIVTKYTTKLVCD